MPYLQRKLRWSVTFSVAIALLLVLNLPIAQAQMPKLKMTPLAADQLLWKTYAAIPIPKDQQLLMAVRLVPLVPGKGCWVDVLVTKRRVTTRSRGGELLWRHSCEKPPTGDFRSSSLMSERIQRLERLIQSPRYRHYDRTRTTLPTRPLEPQHDITYMTQYTTLQVEQRQDLPRQALPTAIQSVLEQFWMMLSERVT